MDWRAYWEEFPQKFGEQDFCQQVGRTARGGVPTPGSELAVVLREVASGLELSSSDRLMDLCCGNGMLTAQLATSCSRVFGVDFSAPMVELADRHHAAANISYHCGSVLELGDIEWPEPPRCNKVCMFESLQYFSPDQLPPLLASVSEIACEAVTIYFSGVLDKERIWNFFNTDERRAAYEERVRTGTEIMGNWWPKSQLESLANAAGFTVEFRDQDPSLNTAHYRFDARLRR